MIGTELERAPLPTRVLAAVFWCPTRIVPTVSAAEAVLVMTITLGLMVVTSGVFMTARLARIWEPTVAQFTAQGEDKTTAESSARQLMRENGAMHVLGRAERAILNVLVLTLAWLGVALLLRTDRRVIAAVVGCSVTLAAVRLLRAVVLEPSPWSQDAVLVLAFWGFAVWCSRASGRGSMRDVAIGALSLGGAAGAFGFANRGQPWPLVDTAVLALTLGLLVFYIVRHGNSIVTMVLIAVCVASVVSLVTLVGQDVIAYYHGRPRSFTLAALAPADATLSHVLGRLEIPQLWWGFVAAAGLCQATERSYVATATVVQVALILLMLFPIVT